MEMTLKEFMETVADKLEVMAMKIRKLQDIVYVLPRNLVVALFFVIVATL
jgi:hypothetical protein